MSIQIEHLSHAFGARIALNDVSMNVAAGSIVGLLGANGSGKSTLMRILCGLLAPSSGDVRIAGYHLPTQRVQARREIGYVAQQFGLYEDLTVEENLNFYAQAYGLPRPESAERVVGALDRFHLTARRDQSTGTLSHGWRQRVAMAAALTHRPSILLLDEATAGLDPAARKQAWTIAEEAASQGAAVLLSTHHFDEAAKCDSVVWLHEGSVAGAGRYSRLADSLDRFFTKEGAA